jgi:hypothetical protein
MRTESLSCQTSYLESVGWDAQFPFIQKNGATGKIAPGEQGERRCSRAPGVVAELRGLDPELSSSV